ncbi:hypothetical protein D3C85_1281710 [compost metagenome]
MGISRAVESEIVIAHAIFNPLLLDSITLTAFFDAINLTSKFLPFLVQLISQRAQQIVMWV